MSLSVILTLLLLLGTVQKSTAQIHPILKSATALSTSAGVEFKLIILGGNTCQGIQLFEFNKRDSQSTLVAEIEGICGDTEEETVYKMTHLTAEAFDTSFYQFSFGGQGKSDVFPHFHWPRNSDFQIIVRGNELSAYFDGNRYNKGRLALYDLSGKLLNNSEIVNGRAQLNISKAFKAGVYLLLSTSQEGDTRHWKKIWINKY